MSDRFVAVRRFSDWLGEVYDVVDTESGGLVAMISSRNAPDAKERAEREAAHQNSIWKLRKEAALKER